jgi:hypothetical protein
MGAWNGLIWLRIWESGWFFEGGNELSDAIKWGASPRLAEETGGSRKQLCSTEVVICLLVDLRGR